jgi:glycerophosphoryl diester phosphodiesterase
MRSRFGRGIGKDEHLATSDAHTSVVEGEALAEQDAVLSSQNPVIESGAGPEEPVRWAREARANFLGIHHSLCGPAVVTAAHAADIAVGVFTVNDEATMERLTGYGVDVIITDRADLVARFQADT